MKHDILVIDDDKSFGWLIEKILKDQFNVINVGGGISAMKWLSEGNLPQLILCDFNLPVIDGIAFKDKLNQSGSFRGIPFILISAILDDNLLSDSKRAEISHCLQKPFDPQELRDTINKVLTNHKPLSIANG
ncbi:MAG: response regulator [Cyclobacteriaceae bacterium]|nr:response regulator [Streptococcus sp.]MCB0494109.1 response regulator [Cyclobacteriaceae bacterium]